MALILALMRNILSGSCIHFVPYCTVQGVEGRNGIPGNNGAPGPPGNVFVIPVSTL